MADRSSRWLRIALVLALAAAGVVLLWRLHRRAVEQEEVEVFVMTLCVDVVTGRDPPPTLRYTDPRIAAGVVRLIAAMPPASKDRIDVSPGDTTEAGASADRASHTAIFTRNGRPMLGLRLDHRASPDNIAVIGFWKPAAD